MRVPTLTRLGALLLTALTGAGMHAQSVIEEGNGSYFADIPEGRERPVNSAGNAISPSVSQSFTGPIPTNDWSSSIVFPRYAGNGHGQPMFPWPMSFQFAQNGVKINASPALFPGNGGYFAYFNSDTPEMVVGITGLQSNTTTLAASGDWSMTTELTDGERVLLCTITRGMPYAGFHVQGGLAELRLSASPTIISNLPGSFIFEVNGSIYGAFSNTPINWILDGQTIRSESDEVSWFNLATLPDSSRETIDTFTRHALVEVLDTRVSWTYEAETARVVVTFTFVTESHGDSEQRVLTGLFPHQQPYCDNPRLDLGYETARGRLELIASESFSLNIPVSPILPGIPAASELAREEIRSLLEQLSFEPNPINAPDSYWAGKQMGRIASAAQAAHEIDEPQIRDDLLDRLKGELENWFSTGTSSSTNRIEAESSDAQSGTELGEGENGGVAVVSIGGGDFLTFEGVDLAGEQPARVLFRYASGVGSGGSALLRLRLDSPQGQILAEAAVASSGGWTSWTSVPLGLDPDTGTLLDGTRTLVFTCETTFPGDIIALDWIEWDLPDSGSGSTKDLAYSPEWTTLLANPGSYGMAGELNDHHFHYGYFIAAAATIARFDPEWAAPDQWGALVDLLIKDAANWEREDERFPFLRNFDPYIGHAYASGHAGFAAGNNQESSSESTHFAHAVVLWGEATGRTEIRDLGLFLHSLETRSIEQYWFDVDQSVYPPGAEHPLAGIVWDAGATYATWWTANPEEIQGINLLPLTGGSLYLGRAAEAMNRSWEHLIEENGGPPVEWKDILWGWRALFDPEAADQWLSEQTQWTAEPGHSQAFITYWIRNLAHLGVMNHELSADSPTAAVFERDGIRSYVAYNGSASEREVTFSDGTILCVDPRDSVVARTGSPCSVRVTDLNQDGLVNAQDLTLLLAAWGSCTPPCTADFNDDGEVGGEDLTRLLSDWG